MKKMAEIRKETLEKVAAKLNDEQQKTWKELIGAPFRGASSSPGPSNSTGATDTHRLGSMSCHGLISDTRSRIADDPRSRFAFRIRLAVRIPILAAADARHSTVTLLARLRGLSISQPR